MALNVGQAEMAAEHALEQIRDSKSDVSHEYHSVVVGGRASAVAQYGPDSHAVALVGLTRKSDSKRRNRRKPVKA